MWPHMNFSSHSRISTEYRTRVQSEYTLIQRKQNEHYKRLVLNILGAIEPKKHNPDIHGWSTEDYMWLVVSVADVEYS